MKKHIKLYILLLVLPFIAASCYDRNDFDISAPNLPAVTNLQYTLIGDSVKLTWALPQGHDSLSASIASSDATVSVSGNPTSYTFGLVEVLKEYSFTVKIKDTKGNLSLGQTVRFTRPGAKITKFAVDTINGKVDNLKREITLYLPIGTNVKTLKPTIEFTSGATISPASGTTVDFTNPVKYTVVKDNLTFTYTVTAIVAEAPLTYVVVYNGENVAPIWGNLAADVINDAANPLTTGINKTLKCCSINRDNVSGDHGGQPWSGGALWGANKVNLDPAIYNKFTVMVLKQTAGDVQLEIQRDGENDKDWLRANYSGAHLGEWQELTFMIPAGRTAVINNILIEPAIDGVDHAQTIYWDELRIYKK